MEIKMNCSILWKRIIFSFPYFYKGRGLLYTSEPQEAVLLVNLSISLLVYPPRRIDLSNWWKWRKNTEWSYMHETLACIYLFSPPVLSQHRKFDLVGRSIFLFFFFFCFLRLNLWHMEVLGPGVELELQLLTYPTATAVPDPSCICDLCRSLWQCQILNPLSGARDWVRIFIDTSQFLSWWATTVPTLFFTLAFQAVQLILSLTSLLYLLFFFFLRPQLWHMEIPDQGVRLELQLPVYGIATATLHPSHICNLCYSLQQHQTLSHWARPGIECTYTQTLCQVLNLLSHNRNSCIYFF